jgi:hypothetical protein
MLLLLLLLLCLTTRPPCLACLHADDSLDL